ncbi:hypothetical protein V5D56_06640 [Cellulosimicrobium sp. PMB13]|uniref:hypothetical protein n=1 Tax=Cellulosimicrobium sp. PMB13 TaxID=3120158 RepID=UPI003F4B9A79
MYRAEILKLRTTRAAWVVGGVALAGMLLVQGFLVALPRVLGSLGSLDGAASGLPADLAPDLSSLADPTQAAFQRTVLDVLATGGGSGGSTGITAVCMLLLGVLAVTTDFRTGGIVPTALVQPSRVRVLAGKAGATATVALVVGVTLAVVSAAGLLVAIATTPGARLELSPAEVLGIWGRGLVVLVLLAWFGLAVGTLVRHQVGAVVTVGALALVEPLVQAVVTLLSGGQSAAASWLPLGLASLATTGQGAAELLGGSAPFGVAAALAGLCAWVVVLLGSGALSFRRRDLV